MKIEHSYKTQDPSPLHGDIIVQTQQGGPSHVLICNEVVNLTTRVKIYETLESGSSSKKLVTPSNGVPLIDNPLETVICPPKDVFQENIVFSLCIVISNVMIALVWFNF